MTVYLALGSNEGDREENIEAALKALDALPATSVEKVSEIIETKAEGFDGGDFLNCCARLSTGIPPMRLLEEVKRIEREIGRTNEGVKLDAQGRRIYSDRPIDIDILLYGRREIDTEILKIPHPRMYERDFVMIPLKQIYSKI